MKYTLTSADALTFTEGKHGPYRADSIEFHWGSVVIKGENNVSIVGGSEHTFDGYQYPLEVSKFMFVFQ